MTLSANLGFPRIGVKRELKKAVEGFWSGKISETALQEIAKELRSTHWHMQQAAEIHFIPSNDFSFYDQVLDTTAMLGAIPKRFGWNESKVDLQTYFAMARGSSKNGTGSVNIPAMEMTKWFDTNYHYIVPELEAAQIFSLASTKAVDEYKEAKALGIETRPVLLGPVSYLLLGKAKEEGFCPLSLLEKILPIYQEVLQQLKGAGAAFVQIDEPCLVLDLDQSARNAFKSAYKSLAMADAPEICLTTYFGNLEDNLSLYFTLPAACYHIDCVRAPEQLEGALEALPEGAKISLGVIDGRNIWKTNISRAKALLEKAVSKVGKERVIVAPSCSLLHCPVDLDQEKKLDAELKSWLAFAKQKLSEVALLTKALSDEDGSVAKELELNKQAIASREKSPRIHNPEVQKRLGAVTPEMLSRKNPFQKRAKIQGEALGLPPFPTTTIGSFPQTPEIRRARADAKAGRISSEQYESFLKQEIKNTIQIQDELKLDVLVHGESERNDMVEYFGEQLQGFAFTKNGWVQSYGSRCVKPPVIFGDISRPNPMTVDWTTYANSLTDKPVKGMLTGPVTILQWSFVRDDQPRGITCQQIALAIRDEVQDLEKAGISIIQIDEPAIREGLPLRRSDWKEYLKWAVESFRLSSTGVEDATQIHTHMCYSEFNDMIEAIADLDADVISIEAARSDMELLRAFAEFHYPNEIGPGVYDIHSPNVPEPEFMEDLISKAAEVIPAERIWVNPDCGLKTRGWPEVKESLENMVTAAENLRRNSSLCSMPSQSECATKRV